MSASHDLIAVHGAESAAESLVSVLSDLELSLLQQIAERVGNLSRDQIAARLYGILIPSYVPVDGTPDYIIGFRIIAGRDELLAALGAD